MKSSRSRMTLTLALLASCVLLNACYSSPPGPFWRPPEGPYVGPGPYDGADMYRGDTHR